MGRIHAVSLLAIALLLVLSSMSGAILGSSTSISVTTDRACYDRGDVVKLSITGPSGYMAIEIWNLDKGYLLFIDQVDTSKMRAISVKIPQDAPEGTYTVLVAINSTQPRAVATFLVRNPTFKIVSVEPSKIEGAIGSKKSLSVVIENAGSDGYADVRVVNEAGSTVASTRVFLGYGERKSVELAFTLPESSGVYTWRVEVVDEKYGTVDDSTTITIVASKLATPIPTPPPPPPPPRTTTVATVPPSPTVTMVPTVIAPSRYLYNLSPVAPRGIALREIVVKLPQGELVIPQGTEMRIGGAPLTEIRVEVLTKPPREIATEIPVGPIYSFEPSGAVFSKPITLKLPFNPSKVPTGYRVFIAYYDPELGVWIPVKTLYVNPVEGIAIGETTHFTVFSVVAFRVVYPVKTVVATVTQSIVKTYTATVTATELNTVTETATRIARYVMTTYTTKSIPVTIPRIVTKTVSEELVVSFTKRVAKEITTTTTLINTVTVPKHVTETVTTTVRVADVATATAIAIVITLAGFIIAVLFRVRK